MQKKQLELSKQKTKIILFYKIKFFLKPSYNMLYQKENKVLVCCYITFKNTLEKGVLSG